MLLLLVNRFLKIFTPGMLHPRLGGSSGLGESSDSSVTGGGGVTGSSAASPCTTDALGDADDASVDGGGDRTVSAPVAATPEAGGGF